MRLTIITIAILAISVAGCQKVVEHTCECRNFEGQIVESNTHYGSEDNARDLCEQRQTELNQANPGGSVYTCELD